MNASTLLKLNLDALWNGQRKADSKVRITAIRMNGPSVEELETYDDFFIVEIDGKRTVVSASTEPSTPLIRHPVNDAGAALLCPGLHLFNVRTIHPGTPRAHLALGQAESVHVFRLSTSGQVKYIDYGDFGIFIHSGGAGVDTGRFSAGCQIIANKDGYFGSPTWPNFFLPIKAAMEAHGYATIPYLLTTLELVQKAGLA